MWFQVLINIEIIMKSKKLFCLLFIFFTAVSSSLSATDSSSVSITKTMKSIFDKPGNPLSVEAVAVSASGKYSLASWSQKSSGGRALLKNSSGKWEIVACGGSGLLDFVALESAGMSKIEAVELISVLKKSEKQLSKERRSLFDSFTEQLPQKHTVH